VPHANKIADAQEQVSGVRSSRNAAIFAATGMLLVLGCLVSYHTSSDTPYVRESTGWKAQGSHSGPGGMWRKAARKAATSEFSVEDELVEQNWVDCALSSGGASNECLAKAGVKKAGGIKIADKGSQEDAAESGEKAQMKAKMATDLKAAKNSKNVDQEKVLKQQAAFEDEKLAKTQAQKSKEKADKAQADLKKAQLMETKQVAKQASDAVSPDRTELYYKEKIQKVKEKYKQDKAHISGTKNQEIAAAKDDARKKGAHFTPGL